MSTATNQNVSKAKEAVARVEDFNHRVKADGVTTEQFLTSEVARLQRIIDKPITHETPLFVVGDGTDTVQNIGMQKLLDGVRGEPAGQGEARKMVVFLNQDAADKHARRQSLMIQAKMRLRGLNDENLERMVEALEDANKDELLQLIERCLTP